MKKIVVSGLNSVIDETNMPMNAPNGPLVMRKKVWYMKYRMGKVVVPSGTIA